MKTVKFLAILGPVVAVIVMAITLITSSIITMGWRGALALWGIAALAVWALWGMAWLDTHPKDDSL